MREFNMNEPTFGLTYFLLIHICSLAFQNLLQSLNSWSLCSLEFWECLYSYLKHQQKTESLATNFLHLKHWWVGKLVQLVLFWQKNTWSITDHLFKYFFAALKWFCWCSFSGDCDQTQVVLRVEEGLVDGRFFSQKWKGTEHRNILTHL